MGDSVTPLFNMKREQIAAFVKDPRTVRDMEALQQLLTVDVPTLLAGKVDETTQVIAGVGLTGGGALAGNITLDIGAGTGLSLTADAINLADTAVTPGTYGDATHVGQFTVDQQGRLTSASSVAITFPTSGVTTTGTPASGNLATFSAAGSITNGDLSGDVTTSGTLATTIANNAVTYAKMQDVTATKRVIGRNTAGSGDPEEVTVEQIFSWISGTPAQGDIFYRGASGVARLASGTAGQVLQTNGASANPSWATPSGGAVTGGAYRIHSDFTVVGTPASTTETDLQTYSLPAGTLASDGQVVHVLFSGTLANTVRTRIVRAYWGSTAIATFSSGSNANQTWMVEAWIMRTSATSQTYRAILFIGTAGQMFQGGATTAETLSGAVTIKSTGTSSGTAVANDITSSMMFVEILP